MLETPLIIFPPWINRFYILDLNPKKSFIRWAVEQGLTVFVVSWKSADESMTETRLDDYVLAQVEAIDAVRDALGVESVHAIGYCVAGTMLAATLALLEARGEADKVASATFFTAQVDFSEAGDLKLFIGDEQMELIRQLSADKGYLDGRYMAATFNLLRGRDLIWNYVTNNYLLGRGLSAVRPAVLERRHHQPAGELAPRLSHAALPREQAGAAGRDHDRRDADRPADGEDADLRPGRAARTISRRRRACGRSPTISAGRCSSCWRARAISPAWSTRPRPGNTNIGPTRRRSTGSRSSSPARPRPRAAGGPTGSSWIRGISEEEVLAAGVRVPGKGRLKAIEDAPGSYVKAR